MSWKKKAYEAKASGGGDYLGSNGEDGSGRYVIDDIKMIKTRNEPTQFTVEGYVKVSNPDPKYPDNKPAPVGAKRSIVCQLTKHESAAGNMKAALEAVEPDFKTMNEAKFFEEVDKLVRAAEKDDAGLGWEYGLTKPNTVCPAHGLEIGFRTRRTMTRGSAAKPSHEITVLDLKYVDDQSEETILANAAWMKGLK